MSLKEKLSKLSDSLLDLRDKIKNKKNTQSEDEADTTSDDFTLDDLDLDSDSNTKDKSASASLKDDFTFDDYVKPKSKFHKILDSIKEFVKYNKVVSIVICALTLLLIILLIVLIIVSNQTKASKNTEEEVPQFELYYPYEVPYDDMLNSYTFSRELKDSWTLEEAEEWYAPLDDQTMKSLEDKNTKNIKETLEAAP